MKPHIVPPHLFCQSPPESLVLPLRTCCIPRHAGNAVPSNFHHAHASSNELTVEAPVMLASCYGVYITLSGQGKRYTPSPRRMARLPIELRFTTADPIRCTPASPPGTNHRRTR